MKTTNIDSLCQHQRIRHTSTPRHRAPVPVPGTQTASLGFLCTENIESCRAAARGSDAEPCAAFVLALHAADAATSPQPLA
jgi:hypothetical protein